MLPLDLVLSFFGISVLLALSPGPDNVFVLMQSMLWGRKAGFWVVLGLCTGLIGHTFAVTIGLAAVFAASATAFNTIKWLGAAYLLYLAWCAFKAKPQQSQNTLQKHTNSPARVLYRRGIIMNLTNPKVSLFFLAFLPQFTSSARGSVALQTISLGALFMLATLLIFGAIAIFSASFGAILQKSARAQTWLHRATGTVFIALALHLALANR